MSLLVTTCSDDELEGYAAIHPEAAEELARRIAAGQGARDVELNELRQQVRDTDEQLEEASGDLERLKERAETCCDRLRKLLDEANLDFDLEDQLIDAIKPLEDLL